MNAKKYINYLILFFILLTLEAALLTGTALIPCDLIRENTLISAKYLCEKAPFFHMSNLDLASRIDRHADAILLNIAYCQDSSTPFLSALSSSYYFDMTKNENINLLYSATNDAAPNYDYMRYWHGSVIFLKPLLAVFSLPQIYGLNALLLTILLLCSAIVIYRDYGKGMLFGFIFASIACSLWYVPFSLEYMPVFVIAFCSIPLTSYVQKKHPDKTGYLFFLLGSLTAYTDFLTTETLTCFIPLILLLHNCKKKLISLCFRSGFSWLSGYGFTWASKWLLYTIFISPDGLSDALSQTAYRTGGQALSGDILQQMSGAFLRNLRCIFPFSLIKDPQGTIAAVICFLLLGMLFFLIRKQKRMPSVVPVYFLLGLLPYLRFVLLSNHAFLHYFFTYRAQYATMLCLFLIFWHGTDMDFIQKEIKKLKHKKR